ncbi:MAG TPA: GDYXXLXY domain-containing protein, partial [Thauera sp.]|nr:GDYXXLXY domain-containing protein [Thauera sp.]
IVGVAGGDVWRFVLAGGSPFAPQADAMSIGAGLVFVAVVGRLTTTVDARTRRAALAAALVLAMLSQPVPGLLVAASLALACFHGGHRGFAALALAAAVAYVGEYYYRLDTSLLVKSALMAISGGVLLALRHALPVADSAGAERTRTDRSASGGVRNESPRAAQGLGGGRNAATGLRLGVAAALVLVVGLTVHAVIDRERVLDEGRIVLFELAPVDPRSLMQGDYMALRFAIDDALPRRAGTATGPLPRFAHVELAADGRASLAGVGDDLPAPSATVAVRIRLRDGAPSVGPNAFFFQEGQAAVFEGARWGEFRVAADGTALLTHLRDEKLQRLGMP